MSDIIMQVIGLGEDALPKENWMFIKSYDPYADDSQEPLKIGGGVVKFTKDPNEAKKFKNTEELYLFRTQIHPTKPKRSDGKPNQPITAFGYATGTIETFVTEKEENQSRDVSLIFPDEKFNALYAGLKIIDRELNFPSQKAEDAKRTALEKLENRHAFSSHSDLINFSNFEIHTIIKMIETHREEPYYGISNESSEMFDKLWAMRMKW